ncbi:aspartyl-phosphate phosphatase Spo0E family protein [Paenibacillus plantiphilus]|uniref:aspartyl-phosphate phosphatase Spo0E family protein n=1 Tax=Paenibacillus plantiphilus TaxID=2905650 RepID=UPI001F45D0CC|nr:aspartyl-phosphate phosphatase Spo0E family protein [Paenibacillus plantiphilus]
MDNLTNRRLERLRGQLVAAAMRKQTFMHREVLLLSQTLDQLIVKAQTDKRKSLNEPNAN